MLSFSLIIVEILCVSFLQLNVTLSSVCYLFFVLHHFCSKMFCCHDNHDPGLIFDLGDIDDTHFCMGLATINTVTPQINAR